MSIVRANVWQNTSGVAYGTVLQIQATTVLGVASTNDTNTTGIGGDVGLNVTINPLSANSKFLVVVTIGIGSTSGNTWAGILSRNGIKVGNGTAEAQRGGALFRSVDHAGNNGTDVNHGVGASGSFMDNTSGSPGTPITYRLGIVGEGAPSWINRVESDYTAGDGGVSAAAARCSSTITVMEIVK
jgi:hypothetical protein